MGLNVENILKVADAIEQHSIPDLGFNMACYVTTADEWTPSLGINDCGTVACVAGWTCAVATPGITGPRLQEAERDDTILAYSMAKSTLRLTEDEARELFTPNNFHLNIHTSKHAVRALRILAITGKVDWAAAMDEREPVLPALPSVATSPVEA